MKPNLTLIATCSLLCCQLLAAECSNIILRMGTFAPGWSFRPEENTIKHVLSKAGYRCGHFGK